MGYRSDVKMVTTKKGWEYIKKKVAEKFGDDCWLLKPEPEPVGDGKYVLFEANSVKWYEDYDAGIATFMGAMRGLEEQGEPYQYARAGEDITDNEEEANETAYNDEHFSMPRVNVECQVVVEE